MKLVIDHIGGLGDAVLDTAYLKLHKQKYPDGLTVVMTGPSNGQVFGNCKYVDKVLIKPINITPKDLPEELLITFDKVLSIQGSMAWHFLADININVIKQRGMQYFSYLDIAEPKDMSISINNRLPADLLKDFDFPVLFCASHCEGTHRQGKKLPQFIWQELINANPHISFLQIGLKNEDMQFDDTDNYIDLKDKLTIDQIVDLVNKTKFFLTTDNFLNHVSGMLQKKGIVFWGSSTPKRYGYNHNVNLYYPENLKSGCSPCLHNRLDPNNKCCQADGINSIPVGVIKTTINELYKELK